VSSVAIYFGFTCTTLRSPRYVARASISYRFPLPGVVAFE